MKRSPQLLLLLASLPFLTPDALFAGCCGSGSTSGGSDNLTVGSAAMGEPGGPRTFKVRYTSNTAVTLNVGGKTFNLPASSGGNYQTKRFRIGDTPGSPTPSAGQPLPMSVGGADNSTQAEVSETTTGEETGKKGCPQCEVKVYDGSGWTWMPIEDPVALSLANPAAEIRCPTPPKDPAKDTASAPGTDTSPNSKGNSDAPSGTPAGGDMAKDAGNTTESIIPPSGGGSAGMRIAASAGAGTDYRGVAGELAGEPGSLIAATTYTMSDGTSMTNIGNVTTGGGTHPPYDTLYKFGSSSSVDGALIVRKSFWWSNAHNSYQPANYITIEGYPPAQAGAANDMPTGTALRKTVVYSGSIETWFDGAKKSTRTYSLGTSTWSRTTQNTGSTLQTVESWTETAVNGDTERHYTRTLHDTAGGTDILAADLTETWHAFSWGKEITKVVVKNWDANGVSRDETTEYDWWDFGAEVSTLLPDNPNHGKIQQVRYPDGSWQVNFVRSVNADTLENWTVRPWKNAAPPSVYNPLSGGNEIDLYNEIIGGVARDCQVTALFFAPSAAADLTPGGWKRASRTEQRVAGTVISRAEHVDYGDWDWSKSYANATTWFATVTNRVPGSSPEGLLRGRPLTVTRLKQNVAPAQSPGSDYISQTVYAYQSATPVPSGNSLYTALGAFHAASPFELTDTTELGGVSPALRTRTVRDLTLGQVVEREIFVQSATPVRVRDEQYGYDSRGRMTYRFVEGQTVETWGYPDDYTEVHQVHAGGKTKKVWDALHRLSEEWVLGAPELSYAQPGTPTPIVNGEAQNDIRTTYSYEARLVGAVVRPVSK